MRCECLLCPKSFQSANDLKRHLKRIHDVNLDYDSLVAEKLVSIIIKKELEGK